MKKTTCLTLCFLLMLLFLISACETIEAPTGEVTTTSVYVECVNDDGFVANINDVGSVYFKYQDADKQFEQFDTVIVEYYTEYLQQKSGTFARFSEQPTQYEWVLKSVKSARLADPSKGEPLFG